VASRDDRARLRPAPFAALRAADPVLAGLIDALPGHDPWAVIRRWPREPFALLVRSIVGQQISTSAAHAIFDRLERTLGGDLSAAAVAARTDDELLAAGLSHAKLRSLRDLSARVLSGDLPLDRAEELSDAELRERLMEVRGVGAWTTELFLIALGREDALPAADVGLRRAVRAAYDLDHLPTVAEVEALGERWRPLRSVAALLLYRSLTGAPGPT